MKYVFSFVIACVALSIGLFISGATFKCSPDIWFLRVLIIGYLTFSGGFPKIGGLIVAKLSKQ